MKKIIIVLVILLLAAIGAAGYFYIDGQKENPPEFGLTGKINDIAELSPVEYEFSYVERSEDAREMFGYRIPFTENSFICAVSGTIKYSIDLNKVEDSDIKTNDAAKTVTIRMPDFKTYSADIEVEYYDKENNLFNPLQPEDDDVIKANAVKRAEKQAEEKGIIKRGQDNTELIISSLITSLPGYEDYTVKCEF